MLIDSDDLAGPGDLSREFGAPLNVIHLWRQRPGFPEPLLTLSYGPVWSMAAVKQWVTDNNPGRRGYIQFVVRLIPGGKRMKRGADRWVVYDRKSKQDIFGPCRSRIMARHVARTEQQRVTLARLGV